MSSSASLTTMITIDSADRNQISYPNPADYTYKLPQSIRNAETVELMMFQMIRAEGSVNSGNSTFTLNKGATTSTVTIPQGTYTYGVTGSTNDFTVALANAFNAVSSGFTVTSNNTTNNAASITNAASFNIIINSMNSRLLGIIAGYDNSGSSNLTGFERGAGMAKSTLIAGNYSLIGTKTPDMNGEPYIILSINDYHPNISLSTPMQNGFITIPLENQSIGSRFSISNDLKEKKGVFKLGPTQTKIDQIKIQIIRGDGSLYDFKGYDHQIVLRIMRKDSQNLTL
jgi:hypothetical protein